MTDGDIRSWLVELRVAGRAPKTLRVRGCQGRVWVRWLNDRGRTLDDASRADAVDFLAGFDDPQTRGSYCAALRSLHGWMVDSGRRPDDPTCRLPSIHRAPGMPHPIPDRVLLDVLAAVDARERAMLMLGRFAGLRVSEIAAAHPDYLRGRPGSEVVRLRGKGGRVRELPAHPEVIAVLRNADGWVFPSRPRPGDHILGDTISLRLARLLPDPWTGHSLRHAFATEAYARTHDIRLVQSWLGHASPATTAIYVDVPQDFAAIRSLHLAS